MDINRLVRTHISTGDLNPPDGLIASLNDGSIALSLIVKSLGEYLVSTDDDIRIHGLTFLIGVLVKVAPVRINRTATQTLTTFFTSKLDDPTSLSLSLQALTILSQLSTFDDASAILTYESLVEKINMKAHAQAIRHMVYILVDHLLRSHRQGLRQLESRFLSSYTKLVDGEKDPRNLMLLFSMDLVILSDFDITDHVEDMFDVTFCYFPIMFRPPPTDPYGISADDLKRALRKCMAASPLFARLALPLFLEKFATAAGSSMEDLLLSIAACVAVYEPGIVSDRGAEILEGIKTEVLYSSNATVQSAALQALETVALRLVQADTTMSQSLLRDYSRQFTEIALQTDKPHTGMAARAIAALTRGAATMSTNAFSTALPCLLERYNSLSVPVERSATLEVIVTLVTAIEPEKEIIRPFGEDLFAVLFQGIQSDTVSHDTAIEGFVRSLKNDDECFTAAQICLVTDSLSDSILTDSAQRMNVIEGLKTIAEYDSNIVERNALVKLWARIPDDPRSQEFEIRSIFRALSHICVQPPLFEHFVIRFLTKLDMWRSKQDASESASLLLWDLFDCLETILITRGPAGHANISKFAGRLLTGTVQSVVHPVSNVQSIDRRLLDKAALLTRILIGNPGVGQATVARLRSQMQELLWPKIPIESDPSFDVATWNVKDSIAVYSAMMEGIIPSTEATDVWSGTFSAKQSLLALIEWANCSATDEYQLRHCLHSITALVNKHTRDLNPSQLVQSLWPTDEEASDDASVIRITRALRIYLHVAKGLAMLQHPEGYLAVNRVLACLSGTNNFAGVAARSLHTLAEIRTMEAKTKGFLHTRILAAQRLWMLVFPQIVQIDKQVTGRMRLHTVTAYSAILPLITPALCTSDLSVHLSFMTRSLALPAEVSRRSALVTIIALLEMENQSPEFDTVLHQCAPSLIRAICACLSSSKTVRLTALRCLKTVPDAVRFSVVEEYKHDILEHIAHALDDHSRAVRLEAVECRAKWYHYGIPS